KKGMILMKTAKTDKVRNLVLAAIFTALVAVFQCLATYTTFFGPFSTAIGLIPIVLGAIMCGPAIGTWLGLVFGFIVLVTGGANLFLAFSVPGTIITVLAKGMLCGFAAGIVNVLLKKFNATVSIIVSALVCPLVNTGVFLLGCYVFFMPFADAIAQAAGSTASGFPLFIAFAMGNFAFEVGMSIVLCPVTIRILDIAKKNR
ncbi:MAG: ECF transporter S component, partial [Clostridia bacterium]|nr:ECF transporter S component [Clostridia bacterium]